MTVLADDCANSPAAWTRRAVEHSDSWAAAGWSRESQAIRFRKIREAIAPNFNRTLTVLDYGCGTGALADHFEGDYIGFDWSLGMVERAKRERPSCEFTTQLRDGDTWDLVVCCGTFNLRDNWSAARTWAVLRTLWPRCKRAMAVSLYCGTDPACIQYQPSEVARVAAELAPAFSVERGYLPHDLLMVLRR